MEFNNVLWKKLEGPYGGTEGLPSMLQQALTENDLEKLQELFEEYLFHQNTIYSASYAAFPHMAAAIEQTEDVEFRKELFILCGLIEASRDEELLSLDKCSEAESEQIYREYMESVERLSALVPAILRQCSALQTENTDESVYLVAAGLALSRVQHTANMLLTFSSGDEYVVPCDNCSEESYLWTKEDDQSAKLYLYKHDPVFEPDQHGEAIQPATIDPESSLYLVAELAGAANAKKLNAQLPYLASEMVCPHCQQRMEIWSSLHHIFH